MRTMLRVVIGTAVVASTTAWSASPPTEARAAAAALFDEARRSMAAGKNAEACPKLEVSQRLWPGIGTLFNLARCYEAVGRTASAWTTYRDVLGQAVAAGQTRRADVIRERVQALEPMLTKLVLEVQSPEEGLKVTRDGIDAPQLLWGVAVPVDPGEHVLRASAPGYTDWEGSALVDGHGTVFTIRVPSLVPLVAASSGPDLPTLQGPRSEAPTAVTPPLANETAREFPSRWQIPVGIGGVALGGVGVAAGVGLGLMAKASADAADCNQSNLCSEAGLSQRNDAVRLGNIGTAVFVGSAALGVAGAVLLLVAPPRADATAAHVQLTVGPAAVSVSASF